MTARRRRKSGSGPSATALIAWVGGAQAVFAGPAGTSVTTPAAEIRRDSTGRIPGGRAIFVGRACGLAAGTMLAFGSVLAGAANLAGEITALPDHTPAGPGAGLADEYRGPALTGPASAAPDPVSVQALTATSPVPQPRLGPVRRNSPVSVDVPEPSQPVRTEQQPVATGPPAVEQPPASPIAPVNPVLDPAASGVDRIAPVGGVLKPERSRGEQSSKVGVREKQSSRTHDERASRSKSPAAVAPVERVVASLDGATKPTRATLGGLLR